MSVSWTEGLSLSGNVSSGGDVRHFFSSSKLFICSSFTVNSSFSDFYSCLLRRAAKDGKSLTNLRYTLRSPQKEWSCVSVSGGVIFSTA